MTIETRIVRREPGATTVRLAAAAVARVAVVHRRAADRLDVVAVSSSPPAMRGDGTAHARHDRDGS